MIEVEFYDTAPDEQISFAVIAARYRGKWVFCKHRERDTLEIPGGHRDRYPDGTFLESVKEAAARELYEETGALRYTLWQIGIYAVRRTGNERGTAPELSYGGLFFAEIEELSELPDMEIEKVELLSEYPKNWTYPQIQPYLLPRIERFLEEIKNSGIDFVGRGLLPPKPA